MTDTNRIALVTGANGHLGGHLVQLLHERGWQVRASVRAPGDPRTRRLAAGVEVVGLDVRDTAAFMAAARGVDTVFHAAATYKYYLPGADDAQEMLRDSIEGVASAVRACAANGVRRLVLTSSMVTLPMVPPGAPPVDERQWREDLRVPYMRAKTLAEQQAWSLARDLGVDMVSVLPAAITGPGFARGTATTNLIESIMAGGMRLAAPRSNLPFVDVRDAAQAHLLAAGEHASGRYIVCYDAPLSYFEIAHLLHRIDPAIPAPRHVLPDVLLPLGPLADWLNHKLLGAPRTFQADFVKAARGKVWAVSNRRARTGLGWEPGVPLEQSFADTVAAIRLLHAADSAALEAAERGAPAA
jgi:dihydroflavonol-4-reductase